LIGVVVFPANELRAYLQQSPGQHEDPLWQQFAPQQLPGQHFAPGLQQEAPVSASADNDNSDVAINAITLAFMEFSSRCEQGTFTRNFTRQTCTSLRGLDPQIVFKMENRSPKLQTRGPRSHGFSNGRNRSPVRNRHERRFVLRCPLNLRLGLFRKLLRTARGRAALAVRALWAARHMPLAMHRGCHRGRGLGHRGNPNHAQQQRCQPQTPPLMEHQHGLSLRLLSNRQSDGRHGLGAPPPGNRTIFSSAARCTDRTTCGVITMASSAMSTFEFLFVVS